MSSADDEAAMKLKAEREARKKAKEEEKALKNAKKAERVAERQQPVAEQVADVPIISFLTPELPESAYGDYALIQSAGQTNRKWTSIKALNASLVGQSVWVRARVQSSRGKGNSVFLVMRQGPYTVQAAAFKSETVSKELVKFLNGLSKESIVDLYGNIAESSVKSCTQGDVEIQVLRVYCVSRASNLPLLIEDAARSEEEILESERKAKQAAEEGREEAAFVRVNQDTRLDNRVIDLRVPAHNAIMRLQSAVCQLWRQTLVDAGFVEIHTPKLIAGSSEGGSAVFKLSYFDNPACLAQSPQLYKQMAICSDLHRVFEIGPVFRAETSNTHRHLCEFTGLDLEMEIYEHYFEALDMLDVVLSSIFHGLNTQYKAELNLISQQYPITPFVSGEPGKNLKLTHAEAIEILRKDGYEMGDMDDFSTEHEKRLGVIIKASHGVDFYSIHRFPDACRPFYTMKCPDNQNYTNSYDIYMRGEEICSGAQRIHDPAMLTTNARAKGIDPPTIQAYIDSFKYGAFPHGGGGVGLERVVMLFLGLNNIRKTSMFPRDPKRLTP